MQRQVKYGTNTIVSIILFTAIMVAINAIPRQIKVLNIGGMRIPLQKEWDMTSNKRFSLSDQTIKILGKLEHPVAAIAFAQHDSQEEKQLQDLLKRYAFQSRNFSYRIEDVERNPVIAQKYKVKTSRTLVLESGGHQERVMLPFNPDEPSAEARITGGLLRMLHPQKSVLYFSQGHGEREIDDNSPQGIVNLKTVLEDDQYVIKTIRLYETKAIPEDATALVIPGMTKDFFPEEIEQIKKFLDAGGRLLWCAPLSLTARKVTFPNADKLLSARGIELQNDLVVSDAFLNLNNALRLLIPAGRRYDNHPITEGFHETTFFPVARSIKVGKGPQGAAIQPLVWTDVNTVEYANAMVAAQKVMEAQNPMAAYNDKVDKKGAACLAVAATYPVGDEAKASPSPAASGSAAASPKPSASPASDKLKTETRIVVFSDIEFMSKNFMEMGGNLDLVMNALGWLTERTEQIAVRHAEKTKNPAALDEDTKRHLTWFAFPFTPAFIGLIGFFVHLVYKKH